MTEPSATAAKPRVLVVDDDPANLVTFQRVFRRDFQMVLAPSGAQALDHLRRQEFDIAVVDYAMPQMDGVEVLRRMQELQPSMSRVMVTAHGDLPVVIQANRDGLSAAVVMKPWDRDDLLKLVMSLCRMVCLQRSMQARRGA